MFRIHTTANLDPILFILIMKNFLKKLLIAGNRAYLIPTLPENILKIQSYPIIRILRFLGGTSFLMLVTKAYLNFHFYFLYIFYFFSVVFTIYHFIISFYRIKHMASEIKSDKFDIRNSPDQILKESMQYSRTFKSRNEKITLKNFKKTK